ncbi:ESX secretion-associated protein EspG [Prauserella sp. PE36]|uniref:ESX secretion-associated protein EspG n=1 Tax=Prauserella sp. PE36 TaxID=1504709 RepID=UPI000D84B9A1|nr:ESX secretion-associated protein EspG [Prauserella sp. PE36]PXY34984.1 hypothetical protein BAY59_05780 [Prauserella coralliicola]RBM19237.1 ESX secretion-associated protein EspG [Prauserella sp. PE36]
MRDESTGWISLHPGELYLVWTELGLGELPAVLAIPHVGRTAAARAELVAIADRALAERGLGTVARPAPDLADLLRALAAPELSLDLELTGDGPVFRGVGAAGAYGDVTAGVADAEVRLGPVRRTALVETMLTAVSPLQAGTGSPGNIRFADYRRACRVAEHEGSAGFLDVLRDAGVRPVEANTLLRAVTGRSGSGRFGASTRARGRAPSTVNWVDTEQGRYALRRRGDWVTVTPVDPARLLTMAQEMASDLA